MAIKRTSTIKIHPGVRLADFVGMEVAELDHVPFDLLNLVRRAEMSGSPSLNNTIVEGDVEKWNEIVVPMFEDFLLNLNLRLVDRPEWLEFEKTEASKCTVMNSTTLTFLKPPSWPLNAPPPPGVTEHEWKQKYSSLKSRCKTKTGFKIPVSEYFFRQALLKEVEVVLLQKLADGETIESIMREANRDSSVGYPIFKSGVEAHMAALALIRGAKDFKDLVRRCRVFYEAVNGHPPPDDSLFFDTVGARTQENRKDQDLLQWDHDNLNVIGTIYNGARTRAIYMVPTVLNEMMRWLCTVVIEAMKNLCPSMKFGSPEEIKAKVDKVIGDETTPMVEGDGSAFDQNVSEELLDAVRTFWIELVTRLHDIGVLDDWSYEMMIGVINTWDESLFISPSTSHFGKLALFSPVGLKSGKGDTSVISNYMQCIVYWQTAYEHYECKNWEEVEKISRESSLPALFYGDDLLMHPDIAERYCEILAALGQNYVIVENSRVILRYQDGARSAVRTLWRSLDAERMKSPIIRDLGAAARFMTFGPHPCAKYTWLVYCKIRSALGMYVYDNPADQFWDATRKLADAPSKARYLFEWIHTQKMNPAYEELINSIDKRILDSDTSKCSIYSFADAKSADMYLNRYASKLARKEVRPFAA